MLFALSLLACTGDVEEGPADTGDQPIEVIAPECATTPQTLYGAGGAAVVPPRAEDAEYQPVFRGTITGVVTAIGDLPSEPTAIHIGGASLPFADGIGAGDCTGSERGHALRVEGNTETWHACWEIGDADVTVHGISIGDTVTVTMEGENTWSGWAETLTITNADGLVLKVHRGPGSQSLNEQGVQGSAVYTDQCQAGETMYRSTEFTFEGQTETTVLEAGGEAYVEVAGTHYTVINGGSSERIGCYDGCSDASWLVHLDGN